MKKINAMKLAMLGAAAVAAFAITGCGGSDNKAATKTITLTVKPVKVKVTSVKQLKAKTLQVHWSS